jgi:2,3-bisphosphoglycerate-dependent phosphoglycerate mutase
LDEKEISRLEIPTGNPLIIKFNKKNEISECKYLDQNRAKDLIVF